MHILSVWIFEMRLDMYYFGCDFQDCCPQLYCDDLKQCFSCCILQPSTGVPVYLSIEMIQPGKSFLKFDSWSNTAFKNYDDLIQIMMSLFFMPINLVMLLRLISMKNNVVIIQNKIFTVLECLVWSAVKL